MKATECFVFKVPYDILLYCPKGGHILIPYFFFDIMVTYSEITCKVISGVNHNFQIFKTFFERSPVEENCQTSKLCDSAIANVRDGVRGYWYSIIFMMQTC